MAEECIFCGVVKKTVPAEIVFENEEIVAFLDAMPRSKGMCIVAPKKHFTFFDEDFDSASKTFDAALIVGERIKESLKPLAIFFSVVQSQVPHFHVRVYPVYKDQIPLVENKPIEISPEEIVSIADQIRDESPPQKKSSKEQVSEKKREEKEIKTKTEDFWAKRMEIG